MLSRYEPKPELPDRMSTILEFILVVCIMLKIFEYVIF